jgi:hypothetical protein
LHHVSSDLLCGHRMVLPTQQAQFLFYMKKVIITYGLLSGAVSAALLLVMSLQMRDSGPDFETGAWYGYAGMLLSLLFVFFGTRSYREQYHQGISFDFVTALKVSALIALISMVCYAITWVIINQTMLPDFMDKYEAFMLDKMRADGAAEEKIRQTAQEMAEFKESYKNPFFAFLVSLGEPAVVAMPVSLLSAFILKRK